MIGSSTSVRMFKVGAVNCVIAFLLSLASEPKLIADQDQPKMEQAEAEQQVGALLKTISEVKQYVRRLHRPRLQMIELATKKAENSLKNKGLGHAQTSNDLSVLAVIYKSNTYWNSIKSLAHMDKIAQLPEISANISSRLGLNSPYTLVTLNLYTHIYQLLEEYANRNPNIKDRIIALRVTVGELLAIAQEGDRLKTYVAAIAAYEGIRDLYDDFDRYSVTDEMYQLSLSIRGFNEVYLESSQLSRFGLEDLRILAQFIKQRREQFDKQIGRQRLSKDDATAIQDIIETLKTILEEAQKEDLQ